jgi:eukaryotic-like serine/threonine-protein kinase
MTMSAIAPGHGDAGTMGRYLLRAVGSVLVIACARDSMGPAKPAAQSRVERVWRSAMPPGADREITSDAAFTSSTYVFVASNRGLTAVSRADGSVRWSVSGPFSSARNVLTSSGLAVAATDESVQAFDLESGRPRWSLSTASSTSNCVSSATTSVIIVCTADWKVIAIDALTGSVRWTSTLRDSLGGLPTLVGTVVSGDTVYAAVKQRYSQTNGFTVGLFFALSLTDGTILHVIRDGDYTDFTGYVGVPAVIGPNLVIPHLILNKLTAVNRFSGSLSWRVTGDPGWIGFVRIPTVVDGVLYAASADRRVYAIDALTGAVRWKSDVLNGSQILAAACGSVVLTWTGETLRILDRTTGEYLGIIGDDIPDTSYEITSPMLVDSNILFVRSQREVRQYNCR